MIAPEVLADVRRVARVVAAVFDVAPEAITSEHKGPARVVHARQVLCYLLYTDHLMPSPTIAAALGRHHSAVRDAVKVVTVYREQPFIDAMLDAMGQVCRDAARVAPAVAEVSSYG